MKLNVCKEINSLILNDNTIASLQLHVSPGRHKLKLQADKINFENCPPDHISKAHIAIRFNLRHFWPSVPSFAFDVLFKYSFTVLRCYFIHLNEFDGHFLCLSLAKIRDTVPLKASFFVLHNYC